MNDIEMVFEKMPKTFTSFAFNSRLREIGISEAIIKSSYVKNLLRQKATLLRTQGRIWTKRTQKNRKCVNQRLLKAEMTNGSVMLQYTHEEIWGLIVKARNVKSEFIFVDAIDMEGKQIKSLININHIIKIS